MLDPTTIVNRPENIIVEFHDGTELPVEKIYYVGGRAECFKVLVDDWPGINLQSELDDLKRDCKIFEEEKESAESELEKAEKDLAENDQKHNEELDKIEDSLESAEQFLGIKTSERSIRHRIAEFARKINEKFDSLEEERESFVSRIKDWEKDSASWQQKWLTETKNGDRFYAIIQQIAETLKIEGWTTDNIVEKIKEKQ